jgi:ectoine hydroxylase-related dioxygenase (phytanoyl-CoA dioxygenase family)
MNSIPTLAVDAADAEILAALDQFGAIIVEDFLSPDIVTGLNGELDVLIQASSGKEQRFTNPEIAEFFGAHVTHLAGLAGKSAVFVDHILCHRRYMALCDHILRPNCADYQLNIAHVMQRGPGSEAQFLHRDAWVWKRLPPIDGEVQLASVIALVDFSRDNGATLVVPGSHRWEEGRYPDIKDAVPAEMKAGSAVIYLGNTFHGGGANVTQSKQRRGIHISYAAGWLRTEENQCLATPRELVRKMPLRAQQLLGFGTHDDIAIGGGYLGTVELGSPHELLQGGTL